MPKLIVLIAFSFLSVYLTAQTRTFDNDSGDSLWTNPLNWQNDELPSSTHSASISAPHHVIIPESSEIEILAIGIESNARLEIKKNSTVNLSPITTSTFATSIGISGELINYGNIKLNNFDHLGIKIWPEGTLSNSGLISFSSVPSDGAQQTSIIENNNQLYNQEGGIIRVFDVGRYALTNKDTLINEGTIIIDSFSNYAITNEGYFLNEHSIITKKQRPNSSGQTARYGIRLGNGNLGFYNNGIIQIDDIYRGIEYNIGQFHNNIEGKILITDAKTYGLQSSNSSGMFINKGDIVVSNSFDGMQVQRGTFTNEITGRIEINEMSRFGINIISAGTLDNSGHISLQEITETSISTGLSGEVINSGTIEINQVGNLSITNSGNQFWNKACGIIVANDSIINDANFLNQGLIKGAWKFLNNDVFTNTGFLENTYINNIIQLTTNSGYITNPHATINGLNSSFNDALIGLGTNINIADLNMSISQKSDQIIGISYNGTTAEWTVEEEAIGLGKFFFDIQISTCPQEEISFRTVTIPVSTIDSRIIWTGAQSDQWDNQANWNLSRLPQPKDHVVIEHDEVIIKSPAKVHSIELNSASLINESELYINGDTTASLSLNNSKFTNINQVSIIHRELHGLLLSNGSRLNNLNGCFTINDRSTLFGNESIKMNPFDSIINESEFSIYSENSFGYKTSWNLQGYCYNENDSKFFLDGRLVSQYSNAIIQNEGIFDVYDFESADNSSFLNGSCSHFSTIEVSIRAPFVNFGKMTFYKGAHINDQVDLNMIENHGIIEDLHDQKTKNKVNNISGMHLTEFDEELNVDYQFPFDLTAGNFSIDTIVYADPELCVPIGTYDNNLESITLTYSAFENQILCFEIDYGCNKKDTSCIALAQPVADNDCQGSALELQALLTFYDSLGGPLWTNNTGWIDGKAGTDCSPCDWHGIICNSSETQIIGISLSNNNLTGQIPQDIGHLRNLKELSIRVESGLTGPIPPQIGELTNLNVLKFDQNSLTGQLPDSLSNLNLLQELNLSFNSFNSTLLPAFSNWTSLRILSLNDAGFHGELPDIFEDMIHLELVSLSNNSFIGPVPAGMSQSDQLTTINLLNTQLGSCIPQEWDNLCNNGPISFIGSNKLPEPILNSLEPFCEVQFAMCHDPNDCSTLGDTLKFLPNNTLSNWSTHQRWDIGRAPDYCDHVIIEDQKLVRIATGYEAKCATIDIHMGGELRTEGTLSINPK